MNDARRVPGREVVATTDDDYIVTMVELEPEICWRLVSRAAFGRVAFVHDGLPVALPVNVGIDEGTIVFRTAEGSMLYRLGDGSAVAFEADNIDRAA